jgi:hypothetical protein
MSSSKASVSTAYEYSSCIVNGEIREKDKMESEKDKLRFVENCKGDL